MADSGATIQEYLNPSRPWQWQQGGRCADTRSGKTVDPDACEGTYAGWLRAKQSVRDEQAVQARAGGGMRQRQSSSPFSSLPVWALPAAVVGVGLLVYLTSNKKKRK